MHVNKGLARMFETKKVVIIPNKINPVSSKEEKKVVCMLLLVPIKNMVIMAIKVGNRPLQVTKLLVSMARSRSRFESIIRQPTIAAALHPNPIHIVSACFPHALHFLNGLSKLYALRGR